MSHRVPLRINSPVPRRRPMRPARPLIENLEQRLTLSADMWTGAGPDSNWSDPANWSNGAPTAGQDLVFPSSAVNFTANNDLTAGTTYNSLTIEGPFTLTGNAIGLTAGISDTSTSGTATDSQDTSLLNGTVAVNNGSMLYLDGNLSGASGLTETGGGMLFLGGEARTPTQGPPPSAQGRSTYRRPGARSRFRVT